MRYLLAVLAFAALTAHAQGSGSLSWQPPSQWANGDPLDAEVDLSGYGIYVDGERVAIVDNDITAYVLDDLSYGSHEFWVTAIAPPGVEGGEPRESAMSNIETKVIPDNRVPGAPNLIEVILAFLHDVIRAFGRLFA